jgi:biopolymer transport protein ExbD
MNTGSAAQINVTPLIDVLLVLLIIFMVITPITPHGLQTQLPQPSPQGAPEAAPTALVLSINRAREVRLNQELVAHSELPARLRRVLSARAGRTVFIQGDATLDYASVAGLIDAAAGSGASRVALLTERAMQGR